MTLNRIEDWGHIRGFVKTGGIDLSSLGNKHQAENFYSNYALSLKEATEILSYICPSRGYNTWLQVTMGIKSLGGTILRCLAKLEF